MEAQQLGGRRRQRRRTRRGDGAAEARVLMRERERPHDPALRPALIASAVIASLLIYGWVSAWL